MRRIRWRKRLTSSGRRLSREQLRALKELAGAPRGITEQMLVTAYAFSPDMLAGLAVDGLATVVTETKAAPFGLTVKIERIRITDDGRRALDG